MNKVESALQRTTDTKALVIGVGTLPRTAEMFNELFPGCRAVVVADTNTWRVAGGEVHRILADAPIRNSTPNGRSSRSWTVCWLRPMPFPWPSVRA